MCDPLCVRNLAVNLLQAKEWIAYADLELSHGNNDKVNAIFGRCLRSSPSVPLWHFYLTYIRRTNPIDRSTPERALASRETISKAFEFSLAHIGSDIEAGMIWYEYLEFLKEPQVRTRKAVLSRRLVTCSLSCPSTTIGIWFLGSRTTDGQAEADLSASRLYSCCER